MTTDLAVDRRLAAAIRTAAVDCCEPPAVWLTRAVRAQVLAEYRGRVPLGPARPRALDSDGSAPAGRLEVDDLLAAAAREAAADRGEPVGRWLARAVRAQLLAEYRGRAGRGPAGLGDACSQPGCTNPADKGSRLCWPCENPVDTIPVASVIDVQPLLQAVTTLAAQRGVGVKALLGASRTRLLYKACADDGPGLVTLRFADEIVTGLQIGPLDIIYGPGFDDPPATGPDRVGDATEVAA